MAEEQQQNTRGAGIGVDPNAIAFRPSTWEQLVNFANMIAKTNFVPRDLQGDGGAVLAAIQYGHEVNLPPMASLQSICVINGRPSIYGSGYWAIVQCHPSCEWVTELPPDQALEKGYGEATVKRKGNPHVFTRKYTLDMAKTAGLLDKAGPWKQHPGIMLMHRARHLAGDAAIPEATKGLIPAEIARDIDIDPVNVTREPEPERKQITQPQPLRKEANGVELRETEPSKAETHATANVESTPVAPAVESNPDARTDPPANTGAEKTEKVTKGKKAAKDNENENTTSKVGKVGSGAPETERAEAPTTGEAADEPAFPDWLAEGTEKEKKLYEWIVSCSHEQITEQINEFTKSFNSIAKERQLAFLRIYNDRRQGKA